MASALSCGCTSSPERDDFDYYATKYTISESHTAESSSDNSTVESAILNVTYRNVTPLFRAIEREKWESILLFLSTGKWSNSIFTTLSEHMRSPSPAIQCKTWVTSYDRKGQPEWSQLPLHAAISYMAPFAVIQRLIDLYPKAVQCTDNEGMLPIHLAFGFGAPENVLVFLLDIFPASVNQRAIGGRLPAECCELGPLKTRGKIYTVITEQTVKRVKNEIDRDWRAFVADTQKSVGVEEPVDVSEKKLSQLLFELLNDRKELQDMKRIAQNFQNNMAPPTPPALKIVELAHPQVAPAPVTSPPSAKIPHVVVPTANAVPITSTFGETNSNHINNNSNNNLSAPGSSVAPAVAPLPAIASASMDATGNDVDGSGTDESPAAESFSNNDDHNNTSDSPAHSPAASNNSEASASSPVAARSPTRTPKSPNSGSRAAKAGKSSSSVSNKSSKITPDKSTSNNNNNNNSNESHIDNKSVSGKSTMRRALGGWRKGKNRNRS